ncbi:MAG: hypothetical protein CBC42_07220 [Betaproteobacteria bacterium TMED82]|nr:MAG: hypothetical protein CBC42_07220 [Betaproteobacteria bacterium TMED82]|tara:strand:+ start:46011 stop:46952 length:942 start_codon:yes stop_codon:yes gene_type:complete
MHKRDLQDGDLLDNRLATLCEKNLEMLSSGEQKFASECLSHFWRAIAYGLEGGKRLRGRLVMATSQAVFGVKTFKGLPKTMQTLILDASMAIECVHAFSLVHDDLPIMDDDKLRRGKNTLHVEYDEGVALLAGDALQTLGTEILSSSDVLKLRRFRLIRELSLATGARGMAGGQMIDIKAVQEKLSEIEIKNMHRLKTGALLTAAVRMGFFGVNKKKDECKLSGLMAFISNLGLAFQVVDDILDATGKEILLGKTVGRDIKLMKPNFVQVCGVEKSRAFAEKSLEAALSSIENYGAEGNNLRDLAISLVRRQK